jgi:N-methylhydantoinase A
VWSVNAFTRPPEVHRLAPAKPGDAAKTSTSRAVFDPALGKSVEAAIVERSTLATGATVEGPALVTEDETTVVLPSSRRCITQSDGTLDVTTKSSAAAGTGDNANV